MKKLIKKLEDIMVAVTFAEAGEFDEAYRCSDAERARDREQETIARPVNKAVFDELRK